MPRQCLPSAQPLYSGNRTQRTHAMSSGNTTRIVVAKPNMTAASTELAQQQCQTVTPYKMPYWGKHRERRKRIGQSNPIWTRSNTLARGASMRRLSRTYISSAVQRLYGCRSGTNTSQLVRCNLRSPLKASLSPDLGIQSPLVVIAMSTPISCSGGYPERLRECLVDETGK